MVEGCLSAPEVEGKSMAAGCESSATKLRGFTVIGAEAIYDGRGITRRLQNAIELYDKGMIYKGWNRLASGAGCAASLSDAGVEHEDEHGKYWPLVACKRKDGGGITVATSGPETMFGDVAIAVSPEDDRYKDLVGEEL